ncbi:MAG: glycosyl hydrolase 53 family protein [Phycisphaerae bacterium]|jgi:arabinogalactan endo-1,4-beta-galactosidase|nr:glycosyl hydrolase 53 family protein [Phycisphaerae bacterium]
MMKLSLVIASVFTCAGCNSHIARQPDDFLVGGDISMLTKIEKLGGVFRDRGKRRDFLDIFKAHGGNCFRLRLFVAPDGKNAVVNDLPYTLALARRIKTARCKLLLNFHYSDTWADPGHQTKPAAWAKLPFDDLEKKVREYTAATIAKFKQAQALPDIVQIGNEITPGMLWPDGRIGGRENTDAQWNRFTRLIQAGIQGVRIGSGEGSKRNVRIMIHIACGGNWRKTKWFFDRLIARKVPFDIIGQSYYPWWHGTLDNLKDNLRRTAMAYGKDIMVVETAYPYRDRQAWKKNAKSKNLVWPISPDGQRAFLSDVVRAVRETPDDRGIGVIWWYPESIPVRGLRVWNRGATALFDSQGNALPAVKAFRTKPSPDASGITRKDTP